MIHGIKAHARISIGIQLSAEKRYLFWIEATGLVHKRVVGEILERSLATAQQQVDLGLQITGFQTVQPFG